VTTLVRPRKGDGLSHGYGRVALVSGGSRGIGAATVRRLAADGWDISFCHHHDAQFAVEVERAASDLGARVLAVPADLTQAAEVTSWVRRAEEGLGPVAAVVSCAGITRDRPLALLEDADWRAVIDTNLDGVFHLCRAVLPAMMERQAGRIVTVTSVSAVYGDADPSSERGVGAARAGIVGFTRALAGRTGRYGIRANAITPGANTSRTDMTAIWPERTTARLTEAIALRRFASAAEAADRVAFLLSDAAADITGTVIEVSGSIGLAIGGLAIGAGLHAVEGLGVADPSRLISTATHGRPRDRRATRARIARRRLLHRGTPSPQAHLPSAWLRSSQVPPSPSAPIPAVIYAERSVVRPPATRGEPACGPVTRVGVAGCGCGWSCRWGW
jgi:3-oxoacyl-[acyl-carrier protein] reductase